MAVHFFNCVVLYAASSQQNLKESFSSDDENDNSLSSHKVGKDHFYVLKDSEVRGGFSIYCICMCVHPLKCSVLPAPALSGETEEEAGKDSGPAG